MSPVPRCLLLVTIAGLLITIVARRRMTAADRVQVAFDAAHALRSWCVDGRTTPLQEDIEAAIVLAGGVDAKGVPHETVLRRLRRAAKLYKLSQTKGQRLILVANGGGTTHKPKWVSPAGYAVPEAALMAKVLHEQGVAPGDIYLEGYSDDTIGNAFYARTVHVDPSPWQRLVVITSDFQMARTRAIYRWVFSLRPLPAGKPAYTLGFDAVSDRGALPPQARAAPFSRCRYMHGRMGMGVGMGMGTPRDRGRLLSALEPCAHRRLPMAWRAHALAQLAMAPRSQVLKARREKEAASLDAFLSGPLRGTRVGPEVVTAAAQWPGGLRRSGPHSFRGRAGTPPPFPLDSQG